MTLEELILHIPGDIRLFAGPRLRRTFRRPHPAEDPDAPGSEWRDFMAKSRLVPVFDGHNDTLLHLALKSPGTEEDFLTGRDGHIDLPKAQAGGLAGGLFAMFTPSKKWTKEIRWREMGPKGPKESKGWEVPMAGRVPQTTALNAVMAMMASLLRVEKLSKGQVKVVRTHRQLTSAMDRGVLAAVMHIEGVEAIRTDLDALGVLYEAGLRSLGPVWSRPNAFGHGVPFNFPDSPDIGPGLTPAGKDLVRLCNQLGNPGGPLPPERKRVLGCGGPLQGSHRGFPLGRLEAVPVPQKPHGRPTPGHGRIGWNRRRELRPGLLAEGRMGDRRTTVKEIAQTRGVHRRKDRDGPCGVRIRFRWDSDSPGHEGCVRSSPPHGALKERGIKGAALKKVAHGNWLRVLKETWKG